MQSHIPQTSSATSTQLFKTAKPRVDCEVDIAKQKATANLRLTIGQPAMSMLIRPHERDCAQSSGGIEWPGSKYPEWVLRLLWLIFQDADAP